MHFLMVPCVDSCKHGKMLKAAPWIKCWTGRMCQVQSKLRQKPLLTNIMINNDKYHIC